MLHPGDLFGSYTIDQTLGEGAMGVVYLATDNRSQDKVALKLIREELAHSADFRARLVSEAAQTGRIDSPHVVKVREHAECDGLPYISLEYVAGKELRDVLGELTLEQKIDVMRQTAEGLKAAHKENLVHRDLKPENLRLTPEGELKILDFGLAKTVSSDTVDDQGNIEGTLYYLSPEQVSGDPITAASDLFSFGTILYEMFTGSRPFEGSYPAAVIYSILHEDPAPPRELSPQLPEWIEQIIMRLLAKKPSARFKGVAELLEVLTQSLATGQVRPKDQYVRAKQTATVLDLKNLSGDPNWDYFCTGFTEDVIRELSRRTDLIVSAEPSTASPRNVREVFERCHSDYVILGSLLKWQSSIKLQLSIYGENGEKLVFGESYQGQADELFDILSRAALATSEALARAAGLSLVDVEDFLKTDVSAYDLYLKGKNYYQTTTPEYLNLAAVMYQRALEIDPNLALAHAGLADVYTYQYMAYYDRTPERIRAALQEADMAIKLAPKLPEAHRSLGRYYMFTGRIAEAELAFSMAIEFNPKYAIAYRSMAWLKEQQGDIKEAIAWATKALELAPTDLETLLLLSMLNMDQQKFTVAMATLQRAIELGPDYGRAYYLLGEVYKKLGVLDRALENMILAIRYKGDPNCYVEAGYIHLVNREYDQARSRLKESVEAGYLAFVAEYYLGFLELSLGNQPEALDHFGRSVTLGIVGETDGTENLHISAYRALAWAAMGKSAEAIAVLEHVAAQPGANGELLCTVARGYALAGELDQARSLLARALAAHAGPTEKELRLDPHFAAVLA
jgi:serine/threonine protein kinase/Flp pilus assembly protein TadD